MDTTWIRIGDLAVQAPVNAGTNLLLSVQCLVYYARLRRLEDERTRSWGLFFLMMSVATLAGVPKHAFRHLLPGHAMVLILAVSNLASGIAVYFAQRATIRSRAPFRFRSALEYLTAAQLLVYLVANLAVGPEITLLIGNTLAGLVPVIIAEARSLGHTPPGGLVAAGLSVSVLSGAAYLGGFSPSPWFNHIDVAHLIMGVSFYQVHTGVARGAGEGGPENAREADPNAAR